MTARCGKAELMQGFIGKAFSSSFFEPSFITFCVHCTKETFLPDRSYHSYVNLLFIYSALQLLLVTLPAACHRELRASVGEGGEEGGGKGELHWSLSSFFLTCQHTTHENIRIKKSKSIQI